MVIEEPKVGLMIPTLNAGKCFETMLNCIENQKMANLRKIIIDSESDDNTRMIAKKHGFEVYNINRNQFTHGLVRRQAIEILSDCDFIYFMTQDAYVHELAFSNLLHFMILHPRMLVAYGRQVVDVPGENYFDQKDREFNYPEESRVKAKKDIPRLGIKTVFSSDTFSIYRREYLENVGCFPKDVRFAEDMYIAARAINSDYEVGYCADAVVTHTNGLNFREQFNRYYNIGKFHAQNKWIQKSFGSNEKDGITLVLTQTRELLHSNKLFKIPELYIRSFIKYSGYRIGKL